MPLSRIGTNSITDFAIGATDLANNSIETYTSNAGRPLTNRNLVINGAMQVTQRGTSVTGITTAGYYTADRYRIQISSAGTWTMNVESSAPTGTEFRNSANLVCTTADSSLSAGDAFFLQHRIEGQNVQGIKKGTANAESLTVSFYVKSSNTGTYICEFFDVDNTRHISKSYTINAANTWEKKTITIPPDTTGQLDNDNAESLTLNFWLAAGTTSSSGTLNDTAWASFTSANRAVGQLNLANLSGNYWAITGIQLETGTVATPYEWMDYGTELAKCLRYYEKSYSVETKPGSSTFNGVVGRQGNAAAGGFTTGEIFVNARFKVEKRANPTVNAYDVIGNPNKTSRTAYQVADYHNETVSVTSVSTAGVIFNGTSGNNASTLSQHYVADAEL